MHPTYSLVILTQYFNSMGLIWNRYSRGNKETISHNAKQKCQLISKNRIKTNNDLLTSSV